MFKLKAGMAILTLLAAVGVYQFVFRYPVARMNGQDEETILVVVEFNPQIRNDADEAVNVAFFLNGTPMPGGGVAARSPWSRKVQVGKGHVFKVAVTQFYGKYMSCAAINEAGVGDRDNVNGPGEINCIYQYILNK